MLYNNIFQLYNLRYKKKSVSLHRVFHSIRFKVNKGWAQRSPFFMSIRLGLRRRVASFLGLVSKSVRSILASPQ